LLAAAKQYQRRHKQRGIKAGHKETEIAAGFSLTEQEPQEKRYIGWKAEQFE